MGAVSVCGSVSRDGLGDVRGRAYHRGVGFLRRSRMKLSEGYLFGYNHAIKQVEKQVAEQLSSRSRLAGSDTDNRVWIQYRPLMERINEMKKEQT